ncbi:MAG: FtsX-like permease family protein [Clostridiales bacterium]|nr:FtsX-like permease family protein [Clostridiales bacterium]
MKLLFYPKLAWDGIRKNKRLYLPYILTCAGMVMMQYIIHYLAAMPTLDHMAGGSSTKMVLGFGVWVIAFFALAFLLYTNSFLMRRRQKEFGLYNILGMGKKYLSTVLLWETLMVYVISLVSGIICGIALSKLTELGLVRVLSGEVTYTFSVNREALLDTVWIFAVIFLLLLLKGLLSLWRMNVISLLRSENTGEKPPKANYLLGVGGVVLLGLAYYIAVSIESPLLALSWFFIAVIMVILATYMIFISGSVMLCRILQKNKRYYYQKNHFVSVSSMAFRMKRNGAGLASVCILSTMVLVMMLGASSLFFGAEDSLQARYPKSIMVYTDFVSVKENAEYTPEKVTHILEEVGEVMDSFGVQPRNEEYYLSTKVAGLLRDGRLIADRMQVNDANMNTMNSVCQVYFIPLEDYNRCMGASETLGEHEALIHCVRCRYDDASITMNDGTVWKIQKQVPEIMGSSNAAMDIIPSVFLVVNDLDEAVASLNSELDDISEDYICRPELSYGFDTDLDTEAEIQLADAIRRRVRELDYTGEGGFYSYNVESREANRADCYGTYGGILFLGSILSVVFLFATVLIIYYKQITEGYEDESRFDVMQKVGMTKKDIRKSVNSQLLTVFLLPFVTAVVHLGFAFPMVQKLLALFNLRNVTLMIVVMAVTVLVFGVFYALVYKLTSNAYYSIVSGSKE